MIASDENESPHAKLERWSSIRPLLMVRFVSSGSSIIIGGQVEAVFHDRLILKPDKGRIDLSLTGASLVLGMSGSNLTPVDSLTIHYSNGAYCNLINLDVAEEWPEFIDCVASPDVT